MNGTPISKFYAEAQQGDTYTPSHEESERLRDVLEQVSLGDQARQTFLRDAWNSLALYAERPWSNYDAIRGVLTETPISDWEVRLSLPYARNALDIIAPKLTANSPSWVPVPASGDEEDQSAARACVKLLNHLARAVKLQSKNDSVVRWAMITGLGVYRVGWDPTKGTPLDDGTVPGCITLDSVPPMRWVCDPGASERDLSDCRWCSQISYMHIDDVVMRWPERGRHVRLDASISGDKYTSGILGSATQNGLTDIFEGNTGLNDTHQDRVRITEYWEPPSPRHPNGYYCVVANDQLILDVAEELPGGRYPFALLRYNHIPGRLQGQGLLRILRGPQEAANRAVSDRLEVLAVNANGKWAVERGSVGLSAMTNEPGEIVEYEPGAPRPVAIPPPVMNPEFERVEQAMIQHINMLAGLSDISTGNISSTISGRALNIAAELEASRLGTVSKEIEDCLSDVGSLMLTFQKLYGPEETMMQIVGKNGRLEVASFYKSALRSTDVFVEVGSMRVQNIAVKREQATLGFTSGAYGDPKDPRAVAAYRKDMEWGDLDYLQGDNPDGEATYAREENFTLLEGDFKTVRALPFEDHIVHMQNHRALLTSVTFREADKERYEAALTHYAEHACFDTAVRSGTPWWELYVPELAAKMGQAPIPPTPPLGQPQPAPAFDAFGAENMPPGQPMQRQLPPRIPNAALAGVQMPQGGAYGPGLGDQDITQEMAQ